MFPTDTDFETKVTLETETSPVDDDLPFKILFLGDWRGSSNTANPADSKLRPIEIDRDNFDEVMNKLQVNLDLAFDDSGNSLTLDFTELDDFHPDKIFERVPLFSNLREIRRKLKNPDTYNEAAGEVRSWIKKNEDVKPPENEHSADVSAADKVSSDDLLDQILGKSAESAAAPQKTNTPISELGALVGKLVKPHIIQTDLEEQANLLLIVDELTSDMMRKIIHHPEFQSLESAWRGLYLLVRKVETDNNLKIFILNIDKSQLFDELKSVEDLTDSRIYQIVSDSDKSWAMYCGNYTFGLNVDDAATLIRLAKIGCDTNVPFISYIKPEMFDTKSFDHNKAFDKLKISTDTSEAKIWNALRSLPEATHLGLALPRFLARLPYGAKTEPTEAFYFEEFTQDVHHEQYLWSNPAFICTVLLAQTFSSSGWDFSNNLVQNFDGLPLYYYQESGETKVKSCAEIVMTQANAEVLIEQGLMPLISFKDTDRVRVGRFQSITFSESMLSGKWK